VIEMHDDKHDPALERLLGPRAAEVSCEDCFELLDEYVDLEVAGLGADARIPGMRPHLDGCPACAEDHASLRELVIRERPV
jgi:anti-sigma factor RsiW